MGSLLQNFYFEHANTPLGEFISHTLVSLLEQKLIDPDDIPLLKQPCSATDEGSVRDTLVCDAITRFYTTYIGRNYIPFSEVQFDGSLYELSQSVGKKTVILDFWASWCGPCIREFPELKSLYQSENVEIIGISIDWNQGAWTKAMRNLQLPWINVRDTRMQIAKAYGVSSVPSKFVIDTNGIMVARNPEDLRALLKQMEK
jgi:thiol-disulfide isomerase/thioredoxin